MADSRLSKPHYRLHIRTDLAAEGGPLWCVEVCYRVYFHPNHAEGTKIRRRTAWNSSGEAIKSAGQLATAGILFPYDPGRYLERWNHRSFRCDGSVRRG